MEDFAGGCQWEMEEWQQSCLGYFAPALYWVSLALLQAPKMNHSWSPANIQHLHTFLHWARDFRQQRMDSPFVPHPSPHKTMIPWSDLRTVLFKLWCAQEHPGDLAKMQILIPLGDSTGQSAFPRSSQVMPVLLVMGRSLGSRHCMTLNQASPWSLLFPSLTCTSHQYHIPIWRSSTAC